MSALASIRHVVWDWNGTLLDDTELCIDVMNELLGERSLPALDRERYGELFDFPVIDYYRRLGFDFSRDPFELVGAEFIRRYEARRAEAKLQPFARQALAALRDIGITQSMLSAYKLDSLESMLIHFGIRNFFEDVVGSNTVYAHGKIDEGRAWLRARSLDPSCVLLIGDTSHDFEVAESMRCRCMLVANGYHPRKKLEKLGAPVLDDLSGVCKELGVNLRCA
jgi:phosphoglycolate phosphatase